MLLSIMIQLIFHLFHFYIQVKQFLFENNFLFIIYLGFITDRSNVTDVNRYESSKLPEFTDVKIFIDSLLIHYQTNEEIKLEIEKTPMICTSCRRDFILGNIIELISNN